jgi:hypothetical protein
VNDALDVIADHLGLPLDATEGHGGRARSGTSRRVSRRLSRRLSVMPVDYAPTGAPMRRHYSLTMEMSGVQMVLENGHLGVAHHGPEPLDSDVRRCCDDFCAA